MNFREFKELINSFEDDEFLGVDVANSVLEYPDEYYVKDVKVIREQGTVRIMI